MNAARNPVLHTKNKWWQYGSVHHIFLYQLNCFTNVSSILESKPTLNQLRCETIYGPCFYPLYIVCFLTEYIAFPFDYPVLQRTYSLCHYLVVISHWAPQSKHGLFHVVRLNQSSALWTLGWGIKGHHASPSICLRAHVDKRPTISRRQHMKQPFIYQGFTYNCHNHMIPRTICYGQTQVRCSSIIIQNKVALLVQVQELCNLLGWINLLGKEVGLCFWRIIPIFIL